MIFYRVISAMKKWLNNVKNNNFVCKMYSYAVKNIHWAVVLPLILCVLSRFNVEGVLSV